MPLRLFSTVLLMCFITAYGVAQAAISVVPGIPIETILARMDQARKQKRTHLRPYDVTRSYKLFGNQKEEPKSEITAEISYGPFEIRHYTVHNAQGLGLGETIVRRMLESEREVLSNQSASDISITNYAFRFLREEMLDGRDYFVLELRPRRKDPKLLIGSMWVDTSTYLIRRIEGEPAKAPSWWIRDVHITLDFGDVQGMWLQTTLSSTAKVRLLGPHTMISRDSEYRLNGEAAAIHHQAAESP